MQKMDHFASKEIFVGNIYFIFKYSFISNEYNFLNGSL